MSLLIIYYTNINNIILIALIDLGYSLSDGGRWSKMKVSFWYPVSQFSSDYHEILQPLLSDHLATTLKI